MFCHKCGNKATSDAVFCRKCGAKFVVDESASQMSDRPPSPPSEASVQVVANPALQQPYSQHPSAVMEEKKKPHQKGWFITLLLILFFPAGVIFLWKNSKRKVLNVVCTLIFGIWFIGVVGALFSYDEPTQRSISSNQPNTSNTISTSTANTPPETQPHNPAVLRTQVESYNFSSFSNANDWISAIRLSDIDALRDNAIIIEGNIAKNMIQYPERYLYELLVARGRVSFIAATNNENVFRLSLGVNRTGTAYSTSDIQVFVNTYNRERIVVGDVLEVFGTFLGDIYQINNVDGAIFSEAPIIESARWDFIVQDESRDRSGSTREPTPIIYRCWGEIPCRIGTRICDNHLCPSVNPDIAARYPDWDQYTPYLEGEEWDRIQEERANREAAFLQEIAEEDARRAQEAYERVVSGLEAYGWPGWFIDGGLYWDNEEWVFWFFHDGGRDTYLYYYGVWIDEYEEWEFDIDVEFWFEIVRSRNLD